MAAIYRVKNFCVDFKIINNIQIPITILIELKVVCNGNNNNNDIKSFQLPY